MTSAALIYNKGVSMTNTDFVAFAYFARGPAMKYVFDNYQDALERAKFWYGLFMREWDGCGVEGAEVTSICVLCPDGNEVELLTEIDRCRQKKQNKKRLRLESF